MISVENLSFAYDTINVLDDVSFELGKGELAAVLGPNGAGKSTLFKCLLGFMKKYDGVIKLDGKDIRDIDRRSMASLAAYVPQSEMPAFNYTVMDTVLMGTAGMLTPLQSPSHEQKELAARAIGQLEIQHLANRGIREISGGERQLSLLARALAQSAKILIMDEPTANLDYGNQQRVLRHIKKMAQQGYTILMSTHNPEHVLQYATQVIAIKDHRILAQGSTEATMDETLIKGLYGLDVKILEIEAEGQTIRSCVPAVTSND